jgi:hypothetical protein
MLSAGAALGVFWITAMIFFVSAYHALPLLSSLGLAAFKLKAA